MRNYLIIILLITKAIYAQNSDSTNLLKEVNIQAIRTNRYMNTSSTILKAKDIAPLNLGQDVPTLFNQLPSIHSSSDAGNGMGYSYLFIRGMDAQRIQVNINGVPYNDAESQEVYWVNIPDILSSTDDIEIQRGVGYSTMGGTGLGGSISIKTTKKYYKPFLQMSTSIGSFNSIKNTISMSTGLLSDSCQITARASSLSSDGYIDRGWSRLGSGYLDISKYKHNYSSHFIVTHGREKTYQSWYGLSEMEYKDGILKKNIAGTDYESKMGDPYPNQVDNYSQTQMQWINNFRWKHLQHSSVTAYLTHGKGYYEEYKVAQEYSSYVPNISGNGDLVRRLWLDNILLGINASHTIQQSKFTNTTALSFHRYKGNHFGRIVSFMGNYTGELPNEYYQNQSSKYDMTAFNKFTYHIGSSHWVVDIQLRNIIYQGEGKLISLNNFNLDRNYTFFNPKLGFTHDISDQKKIYFFAGLSHREPVRSDFLDEDLDRKPLPEKVYNLEIGWEQNTLKSNIKINLFGMYFQNQLIPTGNVNSVGAPIRENVAKSYRAGIEGDWRYAITSKLTLSMNQYLGLNKILDYTHYTITYNEDYSINPLATEKKQFLSTNIAFSPNWISYIELKYQPFQATSIRLMNKIVNSQYLDNTSSEEKSIPLYSTTNASISHILYPKGMKELHLNILFNNILNQSYVSRGYTYNSGNMIVSNGEMTRGTDYNYYFPQAKFNMLMGISMKF